jgi:hypothetical protein
MQAARRTYRGQVEAPTRPRPERCEMMGCDPGSRGMVEDHDHQTGKFRGWICHKCNSGLGMLGDTKACLLAGISYLDRSVPTPNLEQIKALQKEASKLPQLQLETFHYWADGMYCRTLFRPKGALIVGKIHKQEHFYIVVFGDVTVTSDGLRERVQGFRVFTSRPGTKRAVYAHEDSLCLTVHRTNETDIDKLDDALVEEDPTAMYLPGNIQKSRELT